MARKRISFFCQLPTVKKYFLLGLFLTLQIILCSPKVIAQIPTAATLTRIGYEQLHQGHPSSAIQTWSDAYEAYRQLNDSEGMIGSLINQSLGFTAQGLYSSACNTLLIALKLEKGICNSPLAQENYSINSLNQSLQHQPLKEVQVIGLRQMGNILRLIGKPETSFVVLQKALAMTRELKLIPSKLSNQLLLSLADTERTLYFQAKNKYQLTDDPVAKQQALTTAQFQAQSALALYQQVETQIPYILSLTAKLNQLSFLVELEKWPNLTEINLSSRKQLIQPLLQQLLTIGNQFDDLTTIDSIYARLNLAQSVIQITQNPQLNQLNLSEGKNPLLTAISISHQALDTAEKINNTRAKSYALGTIGKIYGCLGQTLESKQYLETAMELAQSIRAWDIAYQWQWKLASLYQQLQNTQKTDEAYTAAISSLDQVRGNILTMNPDIQFDFKEKVEPLYHEYMEFLFSQQGANLQRAVDIQDKLRIAELENFLQCGRLIRPDVNNTQVLSNLPPIIFLIKLENKVKVVVKNSQHFYQHTLDLMQVSHSVDNFINFIRKKQFIKTQSLEYISYSENLYNLLIAPVKQYLPPDGDLIFITDSYFQNIPFNMLNDGNKNLIDSYAISTASSLQQLQAQSLQPEKLKVLFAGISEANHIFQSTSVSENFRPLPEVNQEIKNIQKSISSLSVLLNDKFTTHKFQKKVEANTFPILHLSTHAQFSSDPDNTFLLAWKELLKVQQLKSLLKNKQSPLDLLVLSACETAKGDRRSALGIAGIAAQAGARSTLATLWLVDAESTAQLMGEFYKHLKNGLTKAQALRQAQLSLISSNTYSHPYFWAGFILVGGTL
ncbi:MAG: CHAT domain-containing protein [Nostoc sp.]|uniref:CHAT domain-containing protein n=1 Tax=Nostoc sp. TaxID=1180 RepID=UPI002FFAA913